MSNLTLQTDKCVTADDSGGDLFASLPAVDPFVIKKDQIAAELAALMVFCGKNRSLMAEELQCKKSRVTSILSGKTNLTIKTISEFVSKLDYDFDVVFRKCNVSRPRQPWNVDAISLVNKERHNFGSAFVIQIQTQKEVESDIKTGAGKSVYFSVSLPSKGHKDVTHHPEILDTKYPQVLQWENSFLIGSNTPKMSTLILNKDRK